VFVFQPLDEVQRQDFAMAFVELAERPPDFIPQFGDDQGVRRLVAFKGLSAVAAGCTFMLVPPTRGASDVEAPEEDGPYQPGARILRSFRTFP